MMSRVPFTPTGFKELEAMLYSLPEAELQAEADAVSTDYVAWAIAHVDLNAAQVDFINSFDETFIRQLGMKAGIVLSNRISLELNLPADYEEREHTRGDKWFFDHTYLEIYDNTVQPPRATGALIYEIQFI